MIELAGPILDTMAHSLLSGFVVFLRVGGAMALLPAFGETLLPVRVKLGLAIAFTLVVAPAVATNVAPIAEQGQVIGSFLATEVLIGLAFGAVLRFWVLALQVAGAIMAQSTSLSQLFGGGTSEPQPAIGHLLTLGALALAVMAGVHVSLAQALIGSYNILPPGLFPDAEAIRAWGLAGVVKSFALAFSLAAPFMIAGLIYNVALGAINRAMPQLMVAFVGAPALTAGGLLLLMIAVPLALVLWLQSLQTLLANPFEIAP